MKQLMLVIVSIGTIAFGCGFGCGAPSSSATTRTSPGHAGEPLRLTVMTYNIHHAAGMDKKLDLARIADVIRRSEADLVALQEVDSGTERVGGQMQAEELRRLLNMHHAYGPAMDFNGGKYGNAILSRHRIVSSKIVPLPHTPGERREPRAAIAATIALPPRAGGAGGAATAGGAAGDLVFISTHFDHTRGSPDRLQQAQAINHHLADVRLPAILAGDFNCEPASEPMAELARHWTLVSDGNEAARERPAPSFPSTQPRIKIDHVLVKPPDRWRIVEAKVIDEPVASDHRPVVVRLELAGD